MLRFPRFQPEEGSTLEDIRRWKQIMNKDCLPC